MDHDLVIGGGDNPHVVDHVAGVVGGDLAADHHLLPHGAIEGLTRGAQGETFATELEGRLGLALVDETILLVDALADGDAVVDGRDGHWCPPVSSCVVGRASSCRRGGRRRVRGDRLGVA
jgi:hypothetical protein